MPAGGISCTSSSSGITGGAGGVFSTGTCSGLCCLMRNPAKCGTVGTAVTLIGWPLFNLGRSTNDAMGQMFLSYGLHNYKIAPIWLIRLQNIHFLYSQYDFYVFI